MNETKKMFATGAILFGIMGASPGIDALKAPTLVSPKAEASIISSTVLAGNIDDYTNISMAEEFFGNVSPKTIQSIVDSKKRFVSTRDAYSASLAVVQKHSNTIRRKATERGVPEEVALGVALLENGGSETAKSPAGALGVFQLMPSTARSLGLKVNKSIDERRNPALNIEGGVKYLRMNYDRFGDWGLSTWAYHAGEGNVAKALKIYAKANHGITLPGVNNAEALRNYVEKHDITVHKLLSDPSVKQFTKRLKDDSGGYAYKVVATSALFADADKTMASVESASQTKAKNKGIFRR